MKARQFLVHLFVVLSVFLAKNANGNPPEDPSLNVKQKSIAYISSYTAQGKLEELKLALNEGLDAGLTVNEIKEVLVHLYAYCGFPRSLQGINTFMKELDTRKSEGIVDETGREASPIDQTGDKYERGKEVLEVLTGQELSRPSSGFGAFSPEIDVFLKEHLFADIFERDVLSYLQRELVTIAALASMNDVEPMLQAHLNMGMNVGITESQLESLFTVIETSVGKDQAENGRKHLKRILEFRGNN